MPAMTPDPDTTRQINTARAISPARTHPSRFDGSFARSSSACADRLQGLAVGFQRGLLRPLGLLPHPLGVFSGLAAPVIHQTGFIVPPLTADESLSWWGTPRSIYGLFEVLRIPDCGLRIETWTTVLWTMTSGNRL